MFFSVLNFVFLTASLATSKSSTFAIKLFKLVGTFISSLMSSLSTLDFKAIKSFLVAESDVWTHVAWSNSF